MLVGAPTVEHSLIPDVIRMAKCFPGSQFVSFNGASFDHIILKNILKRADKWYLIGKVNMIDVISVIRTAMPSSSKCKLSDVYADMFGS